MTTLETLTTAATHAMPDASNRIATAATLVEAQQVWPLTSGNFLVGSQSDSLSAHLVTRHPWGCDCKHAQYRQSLCSHVLAAMLTVKLGATYQPSYH